MAEYDIGSTQALSKISNTFRDEYEKIRSHYEINSSLTNVIDAFVKDKIIGYNGCKIQRLFRMLNECIIEEEFQNLYGQNQQTLDLHEGDTIYVMSDENEFHSNSATIISIENNTQRQYTGDEFSIRVISTTYTVRFNGSDSDFPESIKWENIYSGISKFHQCMKLVEIMLVYVKHYIIDEFRIENYTFSSDDYRPTLQRIERNVNSGITNRYSSDSYNSLIKHIIDRIERLESKCIEYSNYYNKKLKERRFYHVWAYGNRWGGWFSWLNPVAYGINYHYWKKVYDVFINNSLVPLKSEVRAIIGKYQDLYDNLLDIRKYLRKIANPDNSKQRIENQKKLITNAGINIMGSFGISR